MAFFPYSYRLTFWLKESIMLPMRLANIGSDKPIRIEENIPNAIKILSEVSAKRNRERKLRLLGTDETDILVADACIGL